jgi:hypothetical protein
MPPADNDAVSALDDKIDDLYTLPLAEFTAARNALAKSLSGDDAKRVKALAKPNVVPWAVNQVYWRARAVYDRLLKSGERLRKAQIAALEGKSTDVRAANDAHRHAITEAVSEAERLSGAAGSKPSPDALTRTFEALSLAPEPPEAPGRLTEALQPAGFEALAGVTPAAHTGGAPPARHPPPAPRDTTTRSAERAAPHRPAREDTRAREREAKRAREEAEAVRKAEEARRQHDAELRKADAAIARAEAHEKLARETWERAHDALLDARKARDEVRRRAREG